MGSVDDLATVNAWGGKSPMCTPASGKRVPFGRGVLTPQPEAVETAVLLLVCLTLLQHLHTQPQFVLHRMLPGCPHRARPSIGNGIPTLCAQHASELAEQMDGYLWALSLDRTITDTCVSRKIMAIDDAEHLLDTATRARAYMQQNYVIFSWAPWKPVA